MTKRGGCADSGEPAMYAWLPLGVRLIGQSVCPPKLTSDLRSFRESARMRDCAAGIPDDPGFKIHGEYSFYPFLWLSFVPWCSHPYAAPLLHGTGGAEAKT